MSNRALALAVVLAVSAIAVTWLTAPDTDRRVSDRGAGHAIVDRGQYHIDNISRIELARRDRPVYAFEIRNGSWWQVEPFEHRMDGHSIRQLYQQAASIEVEQSLTPRQIEREGGSLAMFGLDPPKATISFYTHADNDPLVLRLGRRGIGGRAYLKRHDSDDVYVVGQQLHDRAVAMEVREWRDRRIFGGPDTPPVRVHVSVADNLDFSFTIERDRRRWRMARPVASRVDEDAIDQYLDSVLRATSAGFITDDPGSLGRFGLDPPVAAVTVERAARGSAHSTIGDETDGGVDSRENAVPGETLLVGYRLTMGAEDRFGLIEGQPVVVRLTERVLGALFPDPRLLVALTGCGVFPADVRSIRITTEDDEFRLVRDLDRWTYEGGEGAAVDREAVDQLFHAVTEVRAAAIAFEPYNPASHVGRIVFFAFDGRPIDTIAIGQDQRGRWVIDNGEHVQRFFSPQMYVPLERRDFGLTAGGRG